MHVECTRYILAMAWDHARIPIYRVGISSWIFELDFRVGLSSWTFELDFRVGFSSSTFKLEFRIGVSSWTFEFGSRVELSIPITNIDIDIDYIINCISCLITNNCVIFFCYSLLQKEVFNLAGGGGGGCNLETLNLFME